MHIRCSRLVRQSGIVLVVFALLACPVMAAEEEAGHEGHEKKPKPEAKPSPDSAVSVVLHLPEVQKWESQVEARQDGSVLGVWGEALKTIEGGECWDVAVGITVADYTKILARFCVMKAGGEVFVEATPKDPLEPITYFPYEKWKTVCRPTPTSGGNC